MFSGVENLQNKKKLYQEWTRKLKKAAKTIIEKVVQDRDFFNYSNRRENYESIVSQIDDAKDYKATINACKELKNLIDESIRDYNRYYGRMKQLDTTPLIQQVERPAHSSKLKEQIEKELENLNLENPTPALPQIIVYDNPISFSNEDLITDIDSIESSTFFNALASVTKIKISSIQAAYEKEQNAAGYLSRKAKEFNERIKQLVEKRFNESFKKLNKDAQSYNFELILEKDRIAFAMFRNDKQEVLELDLQSEGFKWFFNLFFGLLYSKGLQKNSIVLLDDPAHHLSVPTRKQLRSFLKQWGVENGVTFVLITHDPFLIDRDHLDELRIVQNANGTNGISITNDFSSIDSNDTDALKSIKASLGVESDFFYSQKVRLVFVEGITDYNYLTTFKILKERESKQKLNLAFLPIGGLSTKGSEEAILKQLAECCDNPILLVDGDKAGVAIKEAKEKLKLDNLTLITLSEIDPSFKEIEDCFSPKLLETYNLKNKKYTLSSIFKQSLLQDSSKCDSITLENFNKILEYLEKNL